MPRKGDYLRWLKPASNVSIPKSTLWRMSKSLNESTCNSINDVSNPVDDQEPMEDIIYTDDLEFDFSVPELSDEAEQICDENVDTDHVNEIEDHDETPLYESSYLTIRQFMLLFLSLIISCNMSYKSAESILQFISMILPQPNNVLKSKYFLKKHFSSSLELMQTFFCETCNEILDDGLRCNNCQKEYKKTELESSNHCFFIPILRKF